MYRFPSFKVIFEKRGSLTLVQLQYVKPDVVREQLTGLVLTICLKSIV